jgi:hypothetical protein
MIPLYPRAVRCGPWPAGGEDGLRISDSVAGIGHDGQGGWLVWLCSPTGIIAGPIGGDVTAEESANRGGVVGSLPRVEADPTLALIGPHGPLTGAGVLRPLRVQDHCYLRRTTRRGKRV